MKLKKTISILLLALSLGAVVPAFSADITAPAAANSSNNDAHASQLLSRLEEIRNMDKSNLTTSEKRALRKEVKEMKKEVRRDRGGSVIYLSLGAVIIIVLLLILLL
jgi:hypothetical protein